MENKHLPYNTVPNKVLYNQNPAHMNQHSFNQGQYSMNQQQQQPRPVGHYSNSFHNQRDVPRIGNYQSKDYVQYPQNYPLKHAPLTPPFPTTGITSPTHSPTSVDSGFQPSYQSSHQDQLTPVQKLKPSGVYEVRGSAGGRIIAGGGSAGTDGGGVHTYPPRNEPKQYYTSDNHLNSGKGQVHSLDRYNYPLKPQTFVNQQQAAQKKHVDYSNSLPRGVISQPQAGLPISLNPPARHSVPTVYTKQDGRFPQQQNGGTLHKNTDSHMNAPSVQTNANVRGEQQYTQHNLAASQNSLPQQVGSKGSRFRAYNVELGSPVPSLTNSSGFSSPGSPTYTRNYWDSANGTDGRIGSPVSVKVGSQGGLVSGDSDTGQFTNVPRASGGNHTPVIQNVPTIYNSNNNTTLSLPSSSSYTGNPNINNNRSLEPQRNLPFNSELSIDKPSGDPGFDNWSFDNFHHSMMANASDQMKSMEENMKRMQRHMEEQFKNFNMNNPTSIAPPDGFPKLMDPPSILPQPPAIGLTGANQPLIPGVVTPVPNFTSPAPSGFTSITPSGQPSPASSMTSGSTPGIPGRTFHPGADNMELNRCIQHTPDGKKQLELKFDMQDFKPDEISVKKDKNKLEVHAHHEEKEPNRVACKVFHQQYHLPKNVRLAKMEYDMDPEGTLTVKSPVKPRHNVKFAEGQNLEQTKLLHPQQ